MISKKSGIIVLSPQSFDIPSTWLWPGEGSMGCFHREVIIPNLKKSLSSSSWADFVVWIYEPITKKTQKEMNRSDQMNFLQNERCLHTCFHSLSSSDLFDCAVSFVRAAEFSSFPSVAILRPPHLSNAIRTSQRTKSSCWGPATWIFSYLVQLIYKLQHLHWTHA